MNDRELLKLAAKPVGAEYFSGGENWDNPQPQEEREFYMLDGEFWYPLEDDGDALRLAVRLGLWVFPYYDKVCVEGVENEVTAVEYEPGTCALSATRRAIVRAAAEIGKKMP